LTKLRKLSNNRRLLSITSFLALPWLTNRTPSVQEASVVKKMTFRRQLSFQWRLRRKDKPKFKGKPNWRQNVRPRGTEFRKRRMPRQLQEVVIKQLHRGRLDSKPL